jgi:hypothetical protein
MIWAYGVTTTTVRMSDLLPHTLKSLANAGFDKPRLFVDGARYQTAWDDFRCEVTLRWPAVKTFASWLLTLLELYLRDPWADRYAVFQDDLVVCRSLKQYLTECPYPPKSYLNLYTTKMNQEVEHQGQGWYLSNQLGKGALALVFDRDALTRLLQQPHMIYRSQEPGVRGWKSVDGAISEAMKQAGYKEYVHDPSLVQHTGEKSTMDNRHPHPVSECFAGEDFDAMTLLQGART